MKVYASEDEPANDIIERIGIETSETLTQTYWTFNEEKILRPKIQNWERTVLEKWGIEIVYVENSQLKLFQP
jgi:hypothetical protein